MRKLQARQSMIVMLLLERNRWCLDSKNLLPLLRQVSEWTINILVIKIETNLLKIISWLIRQATEVVIAQTALNRSVKPLSSLKIWMLNIDNRYWDTTLHRNYTIVSLEKFGNTFFSKSAKRIVIRLLLTIK